MTAVEAEYLEQLSALVAKVIAAMPAPVDDRPLLSVQQVADRLGVGRRYASLLVVGEHGKSPKLRSILLGKRRLVRPADLDAFVASRRVGEDRSND